MWKKVQDSLMAMQLRAMQIVRDFKADERGLSGVVVAILLILVAVLAVAIIWKFMGEYLEELWAQITEKTIS